jgi:hypothetical protein
MRLLAALAVLFAGSTIGRAQSPGTALPVAATEAEAPGVGKKLVVPDLPPLELPVTPYWPNPMGPAQCLPKGMLPGTPSKTSPGDGTEMVWGSIDYLLMWMKNGPLHTPLVTTGSTTNLGILGASDTSVVFGNSDIDFKTFSGARFNAGFWFDRGACWGLDGTFFFTDRQPSHFTAISDANGNPVLARPVTNIVTGLPTAALISDPGVIAGNVTVNATSMMYSWDINVVQSLARDGHDRLELLYGIRGVHLHEYIDIIQNSALLPGGLAGFAGSAINPPGAVSLLDRFVVQNDFYGPQLGIRGEKSNGSFFVNASFKIAAGVSHEESSIIGQTQRFPFVGTPSQVPGGLLALSTNIGRVRHDEFAVVPDFSINVGWQYNPLLRFYVGYNFLYWSDVVRPGSQISTTVNPNFVPVSQTFGLIGGPAAPIQTFQRTDFWAQGVNFGMEVRY